jgi:hypothetical protein
LKIWLLKDKKGGQTCGHLHVAEVEAWRCRDTQPEPSAWSVASAWLTVKDKRPQQDVWYVVLLWVWVVLAPLGAVLSVILLVSALVRQSWEAVFVSVVGLAFCVPAAFFAVECFRKEIGRLRIFDWVVRRCVLRRGR